MPRNRPARQRGGHLPDLRQLARGVSGPACAVDAALRRRFT
ncbi:hypothetical protein [Micromonospora sp. NPDC005173]